MIQSLRNVARLTAAAAFALLLVSCGGSTDTPEAVPLFSTVAVVGASGTDTGNRCGSADPLCFPVPPYAGRSTATNGQLFNQILAARYGSPMVASSSGGFNHAIGGATTGVIPTDTVAQKLPNLQLQTEALLQRLGYQANPQFLYIVDGSSFGNNIRRVIELVNTNPALATTLPTQAVAQAASDIGTVLNRLYAAGARHILLVNSSNLGLHPAVPAAAKPLATGMANGFNGALATQVVPLVKSGSPGLNIYYLDGGALSNEIVANPANFGITNVTAPCYPLFSAPSAPVCATPATYMWWDELHPSAAVHAIIAQRAIALLPSR